MTIFQAIILGIIQGISEFLPISSSGHLAIAQYFFGIEEGNLFFVVVVHVGSIVPVFIFYWRDIMAMLKKPFQKLTLLLIIATLPAVVVGLLFEDTIDAAFAAINFVAIGLAITGTLLLLTDKISKAGKNVDSMGKFDALIIGLAQALAIFPGISRSGSTITAGLFRKIERADAARFSFLMSIPAILGAAVLQVIRIIQGNIYAGDLDIPVLAAGFVASMLAGYLAIQLLLAIIKKAKLKYFAYYVYAVAITLGIYSLV